MNCLPGRYRAHGVPDNWLVLGGRGSGKTRLGAEWTIAQACGLPPMADAGRPSGRIALVGETLGDVREVMIDGPSGIRAVARRDRPRYEPTRRRLVWPSGAVAHVFSSEDPESLRGPQFMAAWCDEIGCPAIDKGPNQPNVFHDPKSSESALPHFSNGGRCDFAQKQFLRAHLDYWNPESDSFQEASNPISPIYGGRMLDHRRIHVWAWDARPFPAFPLRSDVWADGGLWQLGHWLNGRAEGTSVGTLINAILADHGLPAADVALVSGTAHGFLIADPTTARAALESLADVFRLDVWDGTDGLVFADASATRTVTPVGDLALEGDRAAVETTRIPDFDLPAEMVIAYRDPLLAYQSATSRQRRPGAKGSKQEFLNFQGSMDGAQAASLLDRRINDLWSDRETICFTVPASMVGADPGSRIRLEALGDDAEFVVQQVEEGIARRIVARPARPHTPTGRVAELPAVAVPSVIAGKPLALMLDLPMMPGAVNPADQFRIAAWQRPWTSQIVYSSPEGTGYEQRAVVRQAANAGRLAVALGAGFEGRFDNGGILEVELFDGEAASVSRVQVLNGANVLAILSRNGQWEIVQFELADEISPDRWRFASLLRGQLGTGDAAAAGAEAGSPAVLLDGAVVPVGLKPGEAGLALNWRVGPAGENFSDETMTVLSATGGVRALLPLPPVHLRCMRTAAGDFAVTWIRRSRTDADDWDASNVPLGEESECYLVEVLGAGAVPRRQVEVSAPAWTYAAAHAAADFPSAASFTMRLRQIGTGGRLGLAATKTFPIN